MEKKTLKKNDEDEEASSEDETNIIKQVNRQKYRKRQISSTCKRQINKLKSENKNRKKRCSDSEDTIDFSNSVMTESSSDSCTSFYELIDDPKAMHIPSIRFEHHSQVNSSYQQVSFQRNITAGNDLVDKGKLTSINIPRLSSRNRTQQAAIDLIREMKEIDRQERCRTTRNRRQNKCTPKKRKKRKCARRKKRKSRKCNKRKPCAGRRKKRAISKRSTIVIRRVTFKTSCPRKPVVRPRIYPTYPKCITRKRNKCPRKPKKCQKKNKKKLCKGIGYIYIPEADTESLCSCSTES